MVIGMTQPMAPSHITGTVRMSNGTRRPARRADDGSVEFATDFNANASRGRSWRKASTKQATTFEVAR